MNLGVENAPPSATMNGSAGPATAPRPLPTRTRRPGLIAAAVVLIVGFALGGGWLVSSAGGKAEVLVAAAPVPAGHILDRADVRAVSVAGDVRAIAADDLTTVLGQTAAVDLVAGQLLNRDMLTGAAVPDAGQSLVGLALGPGRLPGGGFAAGDRVHALAVPNAAAATAKVVDPQVLAIGQVFAVSGDSTGDTLVTVVVPAESAGRLAAHGATGQVSLIKIAAAAGRASS